MSAGQSDEARSQKVRFDPLSDAAESYRVVMMALKAATADAGMKTLVITSPSAREGKSTLVSNIAIGLAQSGERVVIVDADFHRPRQHVVFEAQRQSGLSSILLDEQSLERSLQGTPIDGLDVLPCGPMPTNPAELLNSDVFGEILSELAGRYDRVLIDAPPVLEGSDARIAAAQADATLLVVRAGHTSRRMSERAHDGLMSVGARLIGVVVNDLPRAVMRMSGHMNPAGAPTALALAARRQTREMTGNGAKPVGRLSQTVR
jgi:capsular exopolysaccharide synthesis family protein